MKTTLKQLATGTFIAILLFAGNTNAKETRASSHESLETTLQLEKWMTNEFIWNANSISFTEIGQETETNLEIENWMTSLETWNFDAGIFEETDETMELENWMTSEEKWSVDDKNTETELTVENWMINENVWN